MPCVTANFLLFHAGYRHFNRCTWKKKTSMVWSWYSYCCVRVLQQTCLPLVLADSRAFRGLGVEKHCFNQ